MKYIVKLGTRQAATALAMSALAISTLAVSALAVPAMAQNPPASPEVGDVVVQSAGASLPVQPRKTFVTHHAIKIGKDVLNYTATAGETYLYGAGGDPIGSIFSFTYMKDGGSERRPVLFVFNGGPGSSSIWLHMGIVGPKRAVLSAEVNPSNVPPFGLADNPNTLLDVADLVFIDPIGTGWSRPIGKGKGTDFWGVNEDADATAQFIEHWLTEHNRWSAPKYVMGESYGSARAALLPRALMGSPFYTGVLRGITLNGIVLLGTTLDARDEKGMSHLDLEEALRLPALADTAWYHQVVDRKGLSLEEFHQAALMFARTDYTAAIAQEKAGNLLPETRRSVVDRLVALTGLPPTDFAKSIVLSTGAFSRQVLAGRGLEVGAYDSRYTLPLANSGGDPVADDPAMGQYVPGFVAALHQLTSQELKIDIDRPYGAIVWKNVYQAWNWSRQPIPQDQSFATDLAVAMRRNPKLQVLVASGYYDLVTNSATAEYVVEKANLPQDRLTLKRYASGHMLYLGDTAEAFSADVRDLIKKAAQ